MNDLRLLGLKVRDRVSGMVGICESVAYDLFGCIQAVVRAPADEKGVVPDGRWFDVARLEVLDVNPVMEIPGGRFSVDRTLKAEPTRDRPGPAEKPSR